MGNQASLEEQKFYQWLENRQPSEKSEESFDQRSDEAWEQCSSQYIKNLKAIKDIELEQEKLKNQLMFLSGHKNCRGGGISLCQVTRKGNIDYSKIEILKDIDLEQYRKPETTSWRITT